MEQPKGFVLNIERVTKENEDFRRVLYTTKNSQLVVMSLLPGEEIGEEIHHLDQFIRCEVGQGEVVLEGVAEPFPADHAVVVPSGTKHNIRNTGLEVMKLYTLYAPPNHKDGTVHHTKAEADADEAEHFDGSTTE